jgi:hypothetical protein
MKFLISSLALISSIVLAEEVTVTGYGSSYNGALDNAKVSALEKGASTFIIGERRARNGNLSEDITQYNGGVLKTYNIINVSTTPLGYEVTIIADIIPKNNTIKKQRYTEQLEEYKSKKKIINKLDNMGTTFYANVNRPSYKIGDSYTTVSFSIDLSWQPKWISDTKSFLSVIDQEGKVSTNSHDNLSTSLFSTMLSQFGIGGAIASIGVFAATKPEHVTNSTDTMLCFGAKYDSSVKCSSLESTMYLPETPRIIIIGKINDKDVVLHEQLFNTTLYKHISSGDSIQNKWLNKYKTTYHQPAIFIFEEEEQKIPLTFMAKNDIIKNVSMINVYVK